MELETREQVENTLAKIRLLEERCRVNEQKPGEVTQARRLTLRSLRRTINRMREDIARYESRAETTSARPS